MTRARRCWISRSRSRSVGTAWPTSRWSAPSPSCSARWPRIRRSAGWSTALAERPGAAVARSGRSRRCPGPGLGVTAARSACRRPGRGRSRRHAGDRAFGEGRRAPDLQARLRVPPDAGVRRPRRRRHRGAAGGLLRPGNATPTTPPTRSRSSTPRWRSCPNRSGPGCWSAATPARGPGVPLATSTTWAWSTRSGCHGRQPVLDALAADARAGLAGRPRRRRSTPRRAPRSPS